MYGNYECSLVFCRPFMFLSINNQPCSIPLSFKPLISEIENGVVEVWDMVVVLHDVDWFIYGQVHFWNKYRCLLGYILFVHIYMVWFSSSLSWMKLWRLFLFFFVAIVVVLGWILFSLVTLDLDRNNIYSLAIQGCIRESYVHTMSILALWC